MIKAPIKEIKIHTFIMHYKINTDSNTGPHFQASCITDAGVYQHLPSDLFTSHFCKCLKSGLKGKNLDSHLEYTRRLEPQDCNRPPLTA